MLVFREKIILNLKSTALSRGYGDRQSWAFCIRRKRAPRAAGIKKQVSDEVKRKRLDILMELASRYIIEPTGTFLGRKLKVIVEERNYEDCVLEDPLEKLRRLMALLQ